MCVAAGKGQRRKRRVMSPRKRLGWFFLCTISPSLAAQEPAPRTEEIQQERAERLSRGRKNPPVQEYASRAEEIRRKRRERALHVQADRLPVLEQRLVDLEKSRMIENLSLGAQGFHPTFGGLGLGQGLSLGFGYTNRELMEDNLLFHSAVRGSVGKAYGFDIGVVAPKLLSERVSAEVLAEYRNLPRIGYYGPGPDSEKGSRTVFRRESASIGLDFGFKPLKKFTVGATGKYLKLNVGPGDQEGVSSTDRVFSDPTTPGLAHQTDFVIGGGYLHWDYRDVPGAPRSGGNYRAAFFYHNDRGPRRHDFRSLHLEAQQYFPFFNRSRVIALRACSVMTFTAGDGKVPFYLQPYIGGPDDLRGFRRFRFYDDHHIVINAEYRWRSFSGLDMVLFFDAGKVVPKRSQVNLHELEKAAGFGFRFKANNAVITRLDFAFSREGVQFWWKFSNVFGMKSPLRTL